MDKGHFGGGRISGLGKWVYGLGSVRCVATRFHACPITALGRQFGNHVCLSRIVPRLAANRIIIQSQDPTTLTQIYRLLEVRDSCN